MQTKSAEKYQRERRENSAFKKKDQKEKNVGRYAKSIAESQKGSYLLIPPQVRKHNSKSHVLIDIFRLHQTPLLDTNQICFWEEVRL